MAKTTGKLSGNLILVSREGEQLSCTTSATFNGTIERIETTCKDDGGAKTYEAGSIDGTIEVAGISKMDTVTNFSAIAEAFFNKTTETWQFGSLDNSDDPYIEFEGFVSDLTWEGPLNAPSTWSGTIVPTGPIRMFNT
jgi:hypothetical protein